MEHHGDSKEERQLIMDQLQQHIWFPYMSFMQLEELASCLHLKGASKIAEEALLCKLGQEHLPARRAYKLQPIKSRNFDLVGKTVEVHLDIKRDDCAKLYPFGKMTFEPFNLGGKIFVIQAYYHRDEGGSTCFGLYSQSPPQTALNISVEFEYSVKRRPDMEFAVLARNRALITPVVGTGYRNIFQLPWISLLQRDVTFF
ncbi:BTB/POZ domain-containing protein POB1-like [Lotus japonicus]|uniref:BTB/POZ domain-containing protein POB1-like n=1 Tax=Lotus japonicus TaxID=34305 RepID=UPI002582AC36|nr:BTB/POZ domain-containing protein POB1-like [Lotus japonicus]